MSRCFLLSRKDEANHRCPERALQESRGQHGRDGDVRLETRADVSGGDLEEASQKNPKPRDLASIDADEVQCRKRRDKAHATPQHEPVAAGED